MPTYLIYLNGLLLGLSLIMALGPQNIFLIRQAVSRKHVVLSMLTCFICDALLITASITGLHHTLETHEMVRIIMIWMGSAFLLFYGIKMIRGAFKNNNRHTDLAESTTSRWKIIALSLGFSLLNPHAIIDSFVLIGGGSSQFPAHQEAFLFGAITSSFIWFSLLTFTTQYFSKTLSKTIIWQSIEFISGVIMVILCFKLIYNQ